MNYLNCSSCSFMSASLTYEPVIGTIWLKRSCFNCAWAPRESAYTLIILCTCSKCDKICVSHSYHEVKCAIYLSSVEESTMPEHVGASRAGCCECAQDSWTLRCIWFCLCMFLWLSKPWVSLTAFIWLTDCNPLCSTEEQSHLHLGCPAGGQQRNITFTFLGELSL